jgi:hypothetical protein
MALADSRQQTADSRQPAADCLPIEFVSWCAVQPVIVLVHHIQLPRSIPVLASNGYGVSE